MSPKQTHVFLSILDMIDDFDGTEIKLEATPNTEDDLTFNSMDVSIAFDQLMKLENWVKVYSFPQILQKAFFYPEVFLEKNKKKVIDLLNQVVDSLNKTAPKKKYSALIESTLEARENAVSLLMELIKRVTSTKRSAKETSSLLPYLDLNLYKEEIILLAVSNLLPDIAFTQMLNAYEENQKGFGVFVDDAVNNLYGRLGLRLGVSIKRQLVEGFDPTPALFRNKSVSYFPLHEPDLIYTYLDAYFENLEEEYNSDEEDSTDEDLYLKMNARFQKEFYEFEEYINIRNNIPSARLKDLNKFLGRIGGIVEALYQEEWKIRNLKDNILRALPIIFWQYQTLNKAINWALLYSESFSPSHIIDWFAESIDFVSFPARNVNQIRLSSSFSSLKNKKTQSEIYDTLIRLHAKNLRVDLESKSSSIPLEEINSPLIHSPLLPINKAIFQGRRKNWITRYYRYDNSAILIRLWASTYMAKRLLRYCRSDQEKQEGKMLSLLSMAGDIKQIYRNWFYSVEELIQLSSNNLNKTLKIRDSSSQYKNIQFLLSFELTGFGLFMSETVTTFGKGLGRGVTPNFFISHLNKNFNKVEIGQASDENIFFGIILPQIFFDWVQDAFEGAFSNNNPQSQWIHQLTDIYDNYFNIHRSLLSKSNLLHTDTMVRFLANRESSFSFSQYEKDLNTRKVIFAERGQRLKHRYLLLLQPELKYWIRKEWEEKDKNHQGIKDEEYDIYRLVRATEMLRCCSHHDQLDDDFVDAVKADFVEAIYAIQHPERLDRFMRLRLLESFDESIFSTWDEGKELIISLLLEFGGNYSFKRLFDKVFSISLSGQIKEDSDWSGTRIHMLKGMHKLAYNQLNQRDNNDINANLPIDIFNIQEKIKLIKESLKLVAYSLWNSYVNAENILLNELQTSFEETEKLIKNAHSFKISVSDLKETEKGRKLDLNELPPIWEIEAITCNPNEFTSSIYAKKYQKVLNLFSLQPEEVNAKLAEQNQIEVVAVFTRMNVKENGHYFSELNAGTDHFIKYVHVHPFEDEKIGAYVKLSIQYDEEKEKWVSVYDKDISPLLEEPETDIKFISSADWTQYEEIPKEVIEAEKNLDTPLWLANYSIFHQIDNQEIPSYRVLSRKEKGAWKPVYWYLDRLLLDEAQRAHFSDTRKEIKLCYLDYKRHNNSWLFTSYPGKNYQIYDNEFTADAQATLSRLRDDLLIEESNLNLREDHSNISIHAEQKVSIGTLLNFIPVWIDNQIQLDILKKDSETPIVDTSNIQWENQINKIKRAFSENDNTWKVTLDTPVPGFPEELEAEIVGLPDHLRGDTLSINLNDPFKTLITGIVHGEAVSPLKKLNVPINQYEDFFRQLTEIKEGVIIELNQIDSVSPPSVLCSNSNGLEINISMQSLFFEPKQKNKLKDLNKTKLQDRKCQVTEVQLESVVQITTDQALFELPELNETSFLNAIVFEIPQDLKEGNFGVLVPLDGIIQLKNFNPQDFSLSKKLHLGDIINVKKYDDHSILSIHRKTIYGEMLWQIVDIDNLFELDSSDIRYLGQINNDVLDDEWIEEDRGLLRINSHSLGYTNQLFSNPSHLSLLDSNFKVKSLEELSDWKLLKIEKRGRQKHFVLQNKNNALICGSLPDKSIDYKARILQDVELKVQYLDDQESGKGLFLVDRVFHLTYPTVRPETNRKKKKSAPKEVPISGNDDKLNRFKEFWRKSPLERPALNAQISTRERRKAQLIDLELPKSLWYFSEHQTSEEWRTDVYIPDEEYLFVPFAYSQYRGKKEGFSKAKVHLFEQKNKKGTFFNASLRRVKPLSVEEFLDELGGDKLGVRDLSPRLFFVDDFDPTTNKHFEYRNDIPYQEKWLLFEYGFGKLLAIPQSQIRYSVKGAATTDNFFYGDSIRKVRFSTENNRIIMDVERTVYAHSTVLFRQSKMHNLVHLLYLDPRNVRIKKIEGVDPYRFETSASFIVSSAKLMAEDENHLQNYLASLEAPETELVVYAILDEKEFLNSRGKKLIYKCVQTSFEEKNIGFDVVPERKLIFLKAGDIVKEKNAYFLTAYSLTNILGEGQAAQRYKISWRSYSARNDYLRNIFHGQDADGDKEERSKLAGQLLLVSTKYENGELIPFVLPESLPNINYEHFHLPLRHQSLLSGIIQRDQHQVLLGIVVGIFRPKKSGSYVVLELKPGLYIKIFSRDVINYADLNSRDIVKIERVKVTVKGKGDKTRDGYFLKPALLSYQSFFPKNKTLRPVFVFPKDDLMKIQGDELEQNFSSSNFWKSKQYFTVGYFPEMLPFNNNRQSKSKYLRVLSHFHKLVYIFWNNYEKQYNLLIPPGGEFKTEGYKLDLHLIGDLIIAKKPPSLTVKLLPINHLPGKREVSLDWQQLSYYDTSALHLIQMMEEESWAFHDSKTGRLKNKAGKQESENGSASLAWHPYHLPREVKYNTTPVIFEAVDQQPSLRFSPKNLAYFGFDTIALFQSLARRSKSKRKFAIAALSKQKEGPAGLWLEIIPGRVVQVQSTLFFTNDGQSMERFHWKSMGTGDLIEINPIDRFPDNPNYQGLTLKNWFPGLRKSLGKQGLLRVEKFDAQKGALYLGYGQFTLELPYVEEEFKVGDLILINYKNVIRKFERFETGEKYNCLLQTDENQRLIIAGLEEYQIIAERNEDKNNFDEVLNGNQDEFEGKLKKLISFCGALPVTVEKLDEASKKIWVSRRVQLTKGKIKPEDFFISKVVGRFENSECVLRIGSQFIGIPANDLFPGLPMNDMESILENFSRKKVPVFIRYTQDGWRGGIREEKGLEIRARSVFSYKDRDTYHIKGIIVESVDSKKFYFVPKTKVGWIDFDEIYKRVEIDKFNQAIWKSLSRLERDVKLNYLKNNDIEASFVDTWDATWEYDNLGFGKKVRVEEIIGLQDQNNGKAIYFAESPESKIPLICIGPEKIESKTSLAVISRKAQKSTKRIVEAILGNIKFRLDLPSLRLNKNLQYQRIDEWRIVSELKREELLTVVESSGEEYNKLPKSGKTIYSCHRILSDLSSDEEKLLKKVTSSWESELKKLLSLNEVSLFEATMLIQSGFKLIHLSSEGSAEEIKSEASQLLLSLIKNLGRRALRSLHVELIINDWLKDSSKMDKELAFGLWRRLYNLGEALFPKDDAVGGAYYNLDVINNLESFSNKSIILFKHGSKELSNVGLAIKTALGKQINPEELMESTQILSQLVNYYRRFPEGSKIPIETQLAYFLEEKFFETLLSSFEKKVIPDIILLDDLIPNT